MALRADGLLLLTAMIWGFAFVAQRMGMEHLGPFTYNGLRFALGAVSLLPVLKWQQMRGGEERFLAPSGDGGFFIKGSLYAGVALFIGASLQQVGLLYTTAGKAGFITGLYVVFVPLIGLVFSQKTGLGTWFGALLAVGGMYLLSVNENFSVSKGDMLVLISALFFAVHVLLIGWLSPQVNTLRLSFYQFVVCAVLSMIVALVRETFTMEHILNAAIPIIYGGVFSVGIAYTLQVVAQKNAHPAHAAIILSLESVFAVLGGWLLLSEVLTVRGLMGCGLMLIGMILTQLQEIVFVKKDRKS